MLEAAIMFLYCALVVCTGYFIAAMIREIARGGEED